MLSKDQRLTGKDVLYITRKRQYINQWLFGFFYIKQYATRQYNQFSSHITIKLSKRSVVRHIFKRAIMQYVSKNNLVQDSLGNTFYKFFIVLSKSRIEEIEKKIANLPKKDTIIYIQDEFQKAWKWCALRLSPKK